MFPIVDVTRWVRIHTEQMGTKPKFWCQDQNGVEFLFKESRPHTGEHWSEKVAAEIACLLNLTHAEIEFATCNGRLGTISKNFLRTAKTSDLIHGNEILFEHDSKYPIDAPHFRLAQHTLDRIISGIQNSGAVLPQSWGALDKIHSAEELFIGYLLLDALIANTDRHHANWAVMRTQNLDGENLIELAPTFDHASSLGRELSDQQRIAKLQAQLQWNAPRNPARRDQTIIGYLTNNHGLSRIYASENDSKPLQPMQVFHRIYNRFPSIANIWIDQLQRIQMSQFEEIFHQVLSAMISESAQNFGLKLIELNRIALISRTFCYE